MQDKIEQILKDIYEAKTLMEINDLLCLKTPEELKELEDTLQIMINDNIIYNTKKNKYILLKNCKNLKIGKLFINKKGFGFVNLLQEDDIYVDQADLNGAVDDDIVLAEITDFTPERLAGRIVKIIKRDLNNLVGTIHIEDNHYYLVLDNKKKKINVEINKDATINLVEGHKVVAKITKNLGHNNYLANVLTIIGHKDDPGVDILSIAYKYGFDEEFNDEVKEELKEIPSEVAANELINRRDLTNKMVFTIDGINTKDIDDAVSLEMDGNNYILGVHIADVSHYVKENTPLGDEAYNRATSVYLANTVIPMIPHELSNGICSLNEGVIRLTMSCSMTFDPNGKMIDYDIYPSYIKSNKKMSYDKVNDILMRNIIPSGYKVYSDTLIKMNELAHILRKEKVKRGYIDFEIPEGKIIQDEKGVAIDIVKETREDGEKLIEDFMIAANECVASHIYNMNIPFLYRIHGQPEGEDVEDFLNMIKVLGYKVNMPHNLTSLAMQQILEELKDKKEFAILSSLLLRSMQKAEYNKENVGHFGLASRAYTHFTSPIRRYPDLVVHRLLKRYLIDKNYSNLNVVDNQLVEIGEHTSEREVASDNAERDVFDMKVAEYMESHIGEEYAGIIDTITNFGFFVKLPNLVEGLVHVTTLKGDHFNYIPEMLAMVGRSTKKMYRLGDKVKVKCIAASKESSTVDFELMEEQYEYQE